VGGIQRVNGVRLFVKSPSPCPSAKTFNTFPESTVFLTEDPIPENQFATEGFGS
jgi:hypothetical protein